MKHAYLILAHHEFELLSLLVQSLDDERNDIFIHFDRKVEKLPVIQTNQAGLFYIEDRKDVRWADVSMVEAEYALMSAARQQGDYSYYHLLSGVDLPIKSQDYIHDFCRENSGKEFVGYYQGRIDWKLAGRAHLIHLFPKHFRERKGVVNIIRRAIRKSFLMLQRVVGYKRSRHVEFKKGTQWVSITQELVDLALSKKTEILRLYRNSFCSDELFIQTLCWNSHFREHIYDVHDEGRGSMRYIGWVNGELIDFEQKDYERIMSSEALFARKFNSSDMNFIHEILEQVNL